MNADPNPEKAIFLEAVERHDPDQWPAFLDRACAGQPDLRGRVEALLEAHREVGTAQRRELAEGTDPGPVATVDAPPLREQSGAVIGTPRTSSITKYGRPEGVAPPSKTLAMLGWSMIASACRSASKRATTCRVSIPAFSTLSATRRRTGSVCSAMNTTPKPPSPICSRSL